MTEREARRKIRRNEFHLTERALVAELGAEEVARLKREDPVGYCFLRGTSLTMPPDHLSQEELRWEEREKAERKALLKRGRFGKLWRLKRKKKEILACAQWHCEEYDVVRKTDLVLDGAEVWEPSFSDGVVRYIGLPCYVLVKDREMWCCDGEEGLKIVALLCPDCEEEEDAEESEE